MPLVLARGGDEPVIGIEHEYRVLRGDRAVDFAAVLHSLPVAGARVDVTDPNAYRCTWGGLVTADGWEAEVATAPVALGPGCTAELEWRTDTARRELAGVLPEGLSLDGYSTHLNVEVDDDVVVRAGRLFVARCAPAMMLLLDRAASPGLLVRPRVRRLELGGEYCSGDQLRAAATFAAAGTLACATAAGNRRARRHLPASVRGRVRPATTRAGWYVDRCAFGQDLYRHGRATTLRWTGGGSGRAQDHLVDAWSRCRPFAEPWFASAELALVDRVVDGDAPLPLEAPPRPSERVADGVRTNPFEAVLGRRRRPGFTVEAIAIGWDAVAFRIEGRRGAVACIPRDWLGAFVADLDAGTLDAAITAFLSSPPSGRVLRSADQTHAPGLFDDLSSPGSIAPPERVPGRPRPFGIGGGGSPTDARRNKRRRDPQRVPRRLYVGAGAAVAVAVAGLAVVVTRDTEKQPVRVVAAPSAPTVSAPAGSEPATLSPGAPGCADEANLKSIAGDVVTDIVFINDTDQPVHAYWLDYDGIREFYEDVAPHDRYTQSSWITHPWVLADAADHCLALTVITGPGTELRVPPR